MSAIIFLETIFVDRMHIWGICESLFIFSDDFKVMDTWFIKDESLTDSVA